MKVACVEKRADPRRHLPERRLHPLQGAAHASELYRRRPATTSPRIGIEVGDAEARPRRDDGAQGRVGRAANATASRSCSRRTRSTPSWAPAASPAPGRSRSPAPTAGRRRCEAKHIVIATGSEPSRRCRASRSTRSAIVTSTGALALAKVPQQLIVDRRRRDRPGAGLGLAPARREGHGGRVPRPHPAGHGRRGRQAAPAHPRRSRASTSARLQGHRRRAVGRTAKVTVEPPPAARPRRSRPTWCWSPSAAGPTPTGLGLERPASRSTSAAASSIDDHFAPTSPASAPSAT